VAKSPLRICGLPIWASVLKRLDSPISVHEVLSEGSDVTPGAVLAKITGNARDLLAAERIVMNLVCHLTGIATLTAQFVSVAGNLKVLDTRKTTPGLRSLEKYAVRIGGGHNHRFSLEAGVLIKENHIVAAGSVSKAVNAAKHHAPHSLRIQCEVCTIEEAESALAAGADALLLDNMTNEQLAECASRFGTQAFLEASGNMNLERVQSLAELAQNGLNAVSVGALIHSRPYADLSMLLEVSK
jgi:nicotinate-nucleotide pyrophosphorylase (carboxylating)